MYEHKLPFKVGQLAESKSFLPGFRGAWFRCKIKEIGRRKNDLGHVLEYFDFPDEKVRWVKLYQKPQSTGKKSKELTRQLMVRPCFPPMYHKSQMSEIKTFSEVVVIVNDAWEVGDLVDWWTDGCYWSASVTEILRDERVRVIELPPPPVGEGCSYEVYCKDLRPSLDWSPQYGWTVPISMDSENRRCAHIMKPKNPVSSPQLIVHAIGEGSCEPSVERDESFSTHMSTGSLPSSNKHDQPRKRPFDACASKRAHPPQTNMDVNLANCGIGKSSLSDSVTTSPARDGFLERIGSTSVKDSCQSSGFSNKVKDEGNLSLNSMFSDTLEAPIFDLEELVNRIKWTRSILEFGIPLPDNARPSWKFVEHRASSVRK